jgi:hypothetical protein
MGVRRHARIASSLTEARDPILTREVCVRGENTRYCIQCSIVSLYSNRPSYFLHPSSGASLLPMVQVSTGYDLRQRKGITKKETAFDLTSSSNATQLQHFTHKR